MYCGQSGYFLNKPRIHACIHTYIHTHTYTHTYRHTYIHTYIHTFIHTHIHTYTYTHTYIHIHTYIHTHTHTHTQQSLLPNAPSQQLLLLSYEGQFCVHKQIHFNPGQYPVRSGPVRSRYTHAEDENEMTEFRFAIERSFSKGKY